MRPAVLESSALRAVPTRNLRAVWPLLATLTTACTPATPLPPSAPPRDAPIAAAPAAPAPIAATRHVQIELDYARTDALVAEFTHADGRTLRVHDFARADRRVLRFAPPVAGEWRYAIRVAASGAEVDRGTLSAAPGTARGLIRAAGHGLAFADGTPFRPLGENRINVYDPDWNWNRLEIDAYLAHMAVHGMNVLRVFVVADVEDEEEGGGRNEGVLDPEVGRYDEAVGAQFDAIFAAAERHGIYVVLVAFALGFSENDTWKSWQDNPYAAMRGGPAATRYDFFEAEAARARAADRLRYLAARYAGTPHLLAIDLLNEPEWDGEIPEVSWTAWAQAMAQAWDEADPYGHLVTVGSVGLHWNVEGDEHAWWASAACDVVQWHLYGKEVYDVHALAAELTRKVRETWRHGKPVLVGEFGWGGEPKPRHDHTHVGLWAATFAGAGVLAHSAPPFNEDSDQPMTPARARHFRVLRDTLDGLPALRPGTARASRGVSAWSLVADSAAAAWLLAPRAGYGREVLGARVELRGLAPGRWRATWLDDVDGRVLARTDADVRDGGLMLEVPPFRRHVAVRLHRSGAPAAAAVSAPRGSAAARD